jgi:hypothetical protein
LSDTEFLLPGSVLPGGGANVSEIGAGGSFPRHDVLKTHTFPITEIAPGAFTSFTCVNHNLKIGNRVKFYDVYTTPSLLTTNNGIFTVHSIPDGNTFTIDFATTTYNGDSLLDGVGKIGTKVIDLSFPNHGFNSIVDITNSYTPKTITRIEDAGSFGSMYSQKTLVTTSQPHGLVDGNTIKISASNSQPHIDGTGYSITFVSTTTFTIDTPSSIAFNGTAGQVTLNEMTVRITTQLPHALVTGDKVRVMQTNSVPSIDGGGYSVTVVSPDSFDILYAPGVSTAGMTGILGMNHEFTLYGATEVGGIVPEVLNNRAYKVREILDQHSFSFECDDYASSTEIGGSVGLYISSLQHGFSGNQENTKNSLLNRSINLQGENYAFLCCPQLATMMNTGSVRNVFARITLDQSPGSMVFAFLSNPKEFDTVPLDKLSELEFSVVNYDNTLYEFNDLDYSFVLEITEVIDTTENFNYSTKRGKAR